MTEAALDRPPALPVGAAPGDSLVRAPSLAPVGDQRRRVARILVLRTVVVSVVLGLSLRLVIKSGPPSRTMLWLQSGILGDGLHHSELAGHQPFFWIGSAKVRSRTSM